MKKSLLRFLTLILFVGCATNAAWGNAYTLKADNGRILPPAGLGINFSGNPASLKNFQAQARYGISRAITLGANWDQREDSQHLSFNARISPYRERNGYTAYAEYFPIEQKLTDCGISFWYNFGFLYTFINLDSSQDLFSSKRETLLTPGVSVALTPRVRLATELAIDPFSLKGRELRAGVGYKLSSRLTSKTMITQKLDGDKKLTYSAGVALEL